MRHETNDVLKVKNQNQQQKSICNAHTHTHYTWGTRMGLRVRTRHLESPKNPDGLNLRIHICVRRCDEVHMCKNMLDRGIKSESWTYCFFSFHIFFLSKKRKERCQRDTDNSHPHRFEHPKPSIMVMELHYFLN